MDDEAGDIVTELYIADIRPLRGREQELLGQLNAQRRARAVQYRMEEDRLRCIAAGLLLNRVLGKDAVLAMRFGAFGKPYLLHGPCFNLSHTGDYVMLATHEAEVGADIERVRRRDPMRLARRFFHPDEYALLEAAEDPMETFCLIWTLKESFIKADGRGFAIPSRSYCILPHGDGAVMKGGDSRRFRTYRRGDDYRMAVCARDDCFPDGPTLVTF